MISVVVNCDTRPGFDEEETVQGNMFNGTRSIDFLTHGIENKKRFFRGFDVEFIVYVDEHIEIPNIVNADTVVYSKHREYWNGEFFPKWNDLNFLQALMLARGKYVVHFDGDMAAFRANDCDVIEQWIGWLDTNKYDYISYPSVHSPDPVHDDDFDYRWASTRFFICKRDTLDYEEIIKCLKNDEYLYGKYGDRKRRCPWLEHILGLMTTPDKVFYPPMEYQRYMIFTWAHYISGNYEKLNSVSYDDVLAYVFQHGGICYPCDVVGSTKA